MRFPKKPALLGNLSDTEWLRHKVKIMYELEVVFREEGAGDPSLVFDEEKELFRFRYDGVFAFSREHANWPELERRGYFGR